MIKKGIPALLILLLALSCGHVTKNPDKHVITVSIPPFEYFVKEIAGNDFVVNVMLPPGADHHSWEPLPGQVSALAGSEAFIINGYLGFEYAWMDRFREVNPKMKISNISENIDLIRPEVTETHTGHHHDEEGTDPHYWISPKEAFRIAASVKDLVISLNPDSASKYNTGYKRLLGKISKTDSTVTALLKSAPSRTFLIFHPALGYLARDYGLEQISFEDEGKDPSPARMKELVDLTRSKDIKIIFIQAEYNPRSAGVLASETGAKLVSINPLNPDWQFAVMEVVKAISEPDQK